MTHSINTVKCHYLQGREVGRLFESNSSAEFYGVNNEPVDPKEDDGLWLIGTNHYYKTIDSDMWEYEEVYNAELAFLPHNQDILGYLSEYEKVFYAGSKDEAKRVLDIWYNQQKEWHPDRMDELIKDLENESFLVVETKKGELCTKLLDAKKELLDQLNRWEAAYTVFEITCN